MVSSSSASASASVSPTPSRSRAASPAAARAAPATATVTVVPPTATVAGDAPPVKHLPTEPTQAQVQERRVRILEGDAVVHVAAARTRGRARAVPEADASKPLGSRARSPSPTTSELTALNAHVPSVDTDHVVSEYSLQPHSHSHSSVQRASSPPPTVAERRSKTTEARVSATRPDTRAISPTRHATSVRVSANASAGTSAEVKGSSSASGRKSSSSSSSSRQRHVRLDGGAAGVDVSGGRRTRASRKPKATVSTSKVLLQAPRPSSSTSTSSSSSTTVRAAGDGARGVTKRAVLIGINYTTSASLQLFGCVNDAVNMRTLLVNCFGFSESNITLMTDDSKVTTNPLHIPTAANILRELQNLTTGLVAGDLAVLHYSGHGLRYTDTSRDEADGRDEAILSKDSKAILDDVLRVLVDRAAATGVRLRMFFDSCHSGTVLDLPYYLSDSGSAVRNTGAALATNALANVVMISGSRDTQYSMDTYLENQPQGAMSCLLQTVLETTAHGMSTTGAVYKWSDVLIALRATLTQMGYSQVPQLSFTQLSMCTSVMDL